MRNLGFVKIVRRGSRRQSGQLAPFADVRALWLGSATDNSSWYFGMFIQCNCPWRTVNGTASDGECNAMYPIRQKGEWNIFGAFSPSAASPAVSEVSASARSVLPFTLGGIYFFRRSATAGWLVRRFAAVVLLLAVGETRRRTTGMAVPAGISRPATPMLHVR